MRLYNAQTCTPSGTLFKWPTQHFATSTQNASEQRPSQKGKDSRNCSTLCLPFTEKCSIPVINPVTTAETTSLGDASVSDDGESFGPIMNRHSSSSSFLFDIDGDESVCNNELSLYSCSSSITTTRSALEAMESMSFGDSDGDLEDASAAIHDSYTCDSPLMFRQGTIWEQPTEVNKEAKTSKISPEEHLPASSEAEDIASASPFHNLTRAKPFSADKESPVAETLPPPCEVTKFPICPVPEGDLLFASKFSHAKEKLSNVDSVDSPWVSFENSFSHGQMDSAYTPPRKAVVPRLGLVQSAAAVAVSAAYLSTKEFEEKRNNVKKMIATESVRPSTQLKPVSDGTQIHEKRSESSATSSTKIRDAIKARGKRANYGARNISAASTGGTQSPNRSQYRREYHTGQTRKNHCDSEPATASDSNTPVGCSRSSVRRGFDENLSSLLRNAVLKKQTKSPAGTEQSGDNRTSKKTMKASMSLGEKANSPLSSTGTKQATNTSDSGSRAPKTGDPFQSESYVPQVVNQVGSGNSASESSAALPEKYARMLKVGLPRQAVENAMVRDGLNPADYSGDKPTKATTNARQDPLRRFRVHWDCHQNNRSNTIWAMIERDSPWLNGLGLDDHEMQELFSQERTSAQENRKSIKPDTPKHTVIDPKRANNGGILLARIKLTFREIALAISNTDESMLSLEQIDGIRSLVPTDEERSLLRQHVEEGHEPLKTECEKFMVELLSVELLEDKIDYMLFMKKFSCSINELKIDATLVHKACEEILSSSRLRKVLGSILYLGNKVNCSGTSPKQRASAITVDSLLKMHQTKVFDRKTTFMQYVAQIIRRNHPELLGFKEDFHTLKIAEKVAWDQSIEELDRIEKTLTNMRSAALDGMTGDMSPDEECNVLAATHVGRFVFNAFLQMNSVYERMEAARLSFEALLDYFGEDEHSTQSFLSSLHKFCSLFENATIDAIASEREKARGSKEPLQMSRPVKRIPGKHFVRTKKDESTVKPCAVTVKPSGH